MAAQASRSSNKLRTLLCCLVLSMLILSPRPAQAQYRAPDDAPTANQNSNSRPKPPINYIVETRHDPVVGYSGGVSGLASTMVAEGEKLNTKQASVQAYARYLDDQVAATAAAAGVADKIQYRFRYTMTGFSLQNPTAAQLEQLKASPEVISVREDKVARVATYTTPKFLGLAGTGPNGGGGVWEQLGKNPQSSSRAGEGVVIGVFDTGAWLNNTCFTDRADLADSGRFVYSPLKPTTFNGTCNAGQHASGNATAGGEEPSGCNRKVVGCQYFNKGLGGDYVVKILIPEEYLDCRDVNGHGSHTASTTAGDYGSPYKNFGVSSGMAPRARLAIYKVLWGMDGTGMYSDVIAGVEKAVADGVDIINYSVGSGGEPITSNRDSVMQAFMQAARAGIFLAAAAGNSGPAAYAVDNPAPWVTTVAATTHSRQLAAFLTLGDGQELQGAGVHTTQAGPAAIALAETIAVAGASSSDAQQCYKGTLDADQAAGKIVVCDRGGINARVEKSEAVRAAGGVGMLLLNVDTIGELSGIVADEHSVPTVHLYNKDRSTVRSYVINAAGNATGTISSSTVIETALAPQMADFSSRGPSLAANGAVLKPDIAAPGVDIYAANAPANGFGLFRYLSGTSMATPHIAGLAALIKQRYPRWSPMAIKSAIMTTAYQTTRTGIVGQPFGTAFDYGAGHVDPTRMLNPGLVFDSTFTDWQKFLCSTERHPGDTFCAACDENPEPCKPYNLNTPSISLLELAAPTTVRRTVKNVMDVQGTFLSAVSLDGAAANYLRVAVEPASFTLASRKVRRLSIKIEALPEAPAGVDFFGSVTWTGDSGTITRIPTVVRKQ